MGQVWIVVMYETDVQREQTQHGTTRPVFLGVMWGSDNPALLCIKVTVPVFETQEGADLAQAGFGVAPNLA